MYKTRERSDRAQNEQGAHGTSQCAGEGKPSLGLHTCHAERPVWQYHTHDHGGVLGGGAQPLKGGEGRARFLIIPNYESVSVDLQISIGGKKRFTALILVVA